jgi:hypothetical protein
MLVNGIERYTITDIKGINADHGLHFFERGTMRFFRSKVERGVYQGPGGIYFVTSEQFVGSNGIADRRKYTVRKFKPETGECCTVGAFNECSNLSDARDWAKSYAKGTPSPQVIV